MNPKLFVFSVKDINSFNAENKTYEMVVVVAATYEAAIALSTPFFTRKVYKQYIATKISSANREEKSRVVCVGRGEY